MRSFTGKTQARKPFFTQFSLQFHQPQNTTVLNVAVVYKTHAEERKLRYVPSKIWRMNSQMTFKTMQKSTYNGNLLSLVNALKYICGKCLKSTFWDVYVWFLSIFVNSYQSASQSRGEQSKAD